LGECPPHHSLLACHGCEAGFAWNGEGCSSCDGSEVARPIIAAFIALVAGIAAWFFSSRLSVDGGSTTVVVSASIVLNCLQAMGSISSLDIEWLGPMASSRPLLQMLTFRADFLSLACFLQDYSAVEHYTAGLALLPCVLTVIVTLCGVRRLAGRNVTAAEVTNALGSCVMVLFLPMVAVATVPFQCVRNPDGTSSVRTEPSVLCWESEEHEVMLILATTATLTSVIAPVAFVLTVTLRYPRKVMRPGGEQFFLRYRFVFRRYPRACYVHGLLYVLRSFAIGLIPVISADSPHFQVMLLAAVVVLFVGCLSKLQPPRAGIVHLLDVGTGLALVILLLGSAMLQEERAEAELVFMVATVGLGLVCFIPLVWVPCTELLRRDNIDVFLCHYKREAACRARFWKFALSKKLARSRVFLDSDSLQDAEAIFSTVSRRTRTFVILATEGTLAQPWCAGEITCAHRNGVHIVPVALGLSWPPSPGNLDAAVAGFDAEARQMLLARGITLTEVRDVYEELCDIRPVRIFDQSEASHHVAINAVLERFLGGCPPFVLGSQEALESGRRATRSAGILASDADPEAVAARGVLRGMLPPEMGGTVADVATGSRLRSLVVLLSAGALRDPDFATSLRAALKAGIPPIPVHVGGDFHYPDLAFYQQLEAGKFFTLDDKGGQKALATVRVAYERLFSVTPLRLSPAAPMSVLQAEVEGVRARVERIMLPDGDGRPPSPGTETTSCELGLWAEEEDLPDVGSEVSSSGVPSLPYHSCMLMPPALV